MRDVRGVFAGFFALAIASAIASSCSWSRPSGWATRRAHGGRSQIGMQWPVGAIVIAGVVATFFFDQAFEVFHELFFPSGSFTFDPRTDKLVQLFPFDFWSETTIALGGFILLLAAVVWLVAGTSPAGPRVTEPAGAAAPAPLPTEGPVA